MEQTFLTTLPVWIINLALGGLVCVREPRKASHQAFAAYVLTMVLWSIGVQMAHAQVGNSRGIWWARFTFVAATLISHSFVIFCQVFPDRQQFQVNTSARGVMLLGAGMIACILTPLVLREITPAHTGGIQPHYGSFYPVFGLFMLLAFGHGMWTLMQKWRYDGPSSRGNHLDEGI